MIVVAALQFMPCEGGTYSITAGQMDCTTVSAGSRASVAAHVKLPARCLLYIPATSAVRTLNQHLKPHLPPKLKLRTGSAGSRASVAAPLVCSSITMALARNCKHATLCVKRDIVLIRQKQHLQSLELFDMQLGLHNVHSDAIT
jgi:hypothetical protein